MWARLGQITSDTVGGYMQQKKEADQLAIENARAAAEAARLQGLTDAQIASAEAETGETLAKTEDLETASIDAAGLRQARGQMGQFLNDEGVYDLEQVPEVLKALGLEAQTPAIIRSMADFNKSLADMRFSTDRNRDALSAQVLMRAVTVVEASGYNPAIVQGLGAPLIAHGFDEEQVNQMLDGVGNDPDSVRALVASLKGNEGYILGPGQRAFDPTHQEVAAVPNRPMLSRVGSLDDYLVQTYGPNPTSGEIEEGRIDYRTMGQAPRAPSWVLRDGEPVDVSKTGVQPGDEPYRPTGQSDRDQAFTQQRGIESLAISMLTVAGGGAPTFTNDNMDALVAAHPGTTREQFTAAGRLQAEQMQVQQTRSQGLALGPTLHGLPRTPGEVAELTGPADQALNDAADYYSRATPLGVQPQSDQATQEAIAALSGLIEGHPGGAGDLLRKFDAVVDELRRIVKEQGSPDEGQAPRSRWGATSPDRVNQALARERAKVRAQGR
jgi:hypothetical protein